jgi:outer membrane immunogenic protein
LAQGPGEAQRGPEDKESEMKRFSTVKPALAMSALLAGASFGLPALAGSLAEPVVEAPVAQPAPVVVSTGGDWTGPWIGAKLGYGDVSADPAGDGNGATFGVAGGYDYDFGNFVVGAALDWDKADIDLGAGKLDDIARLKFRVGADLGRTLLYATAGPARASGVVSGVDDNDRWTVGGELLTNQFDDFGGTGTDVRATTVSLNAGLRF